MKSRGKDLTKAYQQARDCLQELPQYELSQYILVTDLELFRLFGRYIETGEQEESAKRARNVRTRKKQ